MRTTRCVQGEVCRWCLYELYDGDDYSQLGMQTSALACDYSTRLLFGQTGLVCEVGNKWGLTRRHGVSAAFEEWRDIVAVVCSTEEILAYKGMV